MCETNLDTISILIATSDCNTSAQRLQDLTDAHCCPYNH